MLRSVIFTEPMVRAILSGRKTQTRRFRKLGEVGDVLWVKEPYQLNEAVTTSDGLHPVAYRATTVSDFPYGVKWRSAISMPGVYSRIRLAVKKVWQHRLQDITPEEWELEGIFPAPRARGLERFIELWDGIYGQNEERCWSANPLVWAHSFVVITARPPDGIFGGTNG